MTGFHDALPIKLLSSKETSSMIGCQSLPPHASTMTAQFPEQQRAFPMKKNMILLITIVLVLSACHSAPKKSEQALEEQAKQAELLRTEKAKLIAENDRLQAQEFNLRELNRVLKSEVGNKQVVVETLKESSPHNSAVRITLLNSILFESGEYELNEQGANAISKLVPTIQKHMQQHGIIRIIGHTDDTSVHGQTMDYKDNWALSSLRAINVVRFLIWHHHLSPDAFRIEGHASSDPKASNATPEGRANNRRIEIILASE